MGLELLWENFFNRDRCIWTIQFDELRAELPKYVQGAQKMLQGLESGVLIAVVNQETGAVTAYVTFIPLCISI